MNSFICFARENLELMGGVGGHDYKDAKEKRIFKDETIYFLLAVSTLKIAIQIYCVTATNGNFRNFVC